MDFSISNIFVLASGNTYPTAGTTSDALTGTQFGVYNQNNVAINAGNAATQAAIRFIQNRKVAVPGLGTMKSDLILKSKIREVRKFTPTTTAVPQITFIGNTGDAEDLNTLEVHCDETYSVTLRLFSYYIDAGFYNGLTQSVTVMAPCCDGCGANCDAIDPVTTLQAIVDKINAHPKLSLYVTAALVTNTTDVDNPLYGISLTGKALTQYGPVVGDPWSFPPIYDKLTFDTFAYKGADTSQDFMTYDRCDNWPVTVDQTSTYVIGGAEEIFALERRYHSYQTTYKDIFSSPEWNGAFERYSVPGTFYTMYYIQYDNSHNGNWVDNVPQDSVDIVAIPSTDSTSITAFEGIINAYFGAGVLTVGTVVGTGVIPS